MESPTVVVGMPRVVEGALVVFVLASTVKGRARGAQKKTSGAAIGDSRTRGWRLKEMVMQLCWGRGRLGF